MYFDSHIHSEGLGFSELKTMSSAGIKKAITLAFYPVKPLYPQTFVDMFRKLMEFETKRCKEAGIDVYPAVGIHPRCIPPKYEFVVNYMDENDWFAFGEIGLETASREEVEVLKSQLRVAKQNDVPCIIHTPRSNKREITMKTLEILKELSFPGELTVIDHVNFDSLEVVLKADYWIGLTVQPGKLKPEDAARIVDTHGTERFMLNSDAGFSDSDYTAVAKAARLIEGRLGSEADKVVYRNAKKFLRI